MGTGVFTLNKEAAIKENGKITTCMASVNFIIKMEKLLTRATGRITNTMGKVEFTTKILSRLLANITIRIYRNSVIVGNIMTANLKMT